MIDRINDTASGGHATGDTLDRIQNLIGSEYDDILIGNDNANQLTGNDGVDTLTGWGGADRFELHFEGGTDTVTDFSVDEGDKVLIGTQSADETSISELGLTITDNGGNAEFMHSGEMVMVLLDVDASLITDDANFDSYFEIYHSFEFGLG